MEDNRPCKGLIKLKHGLEKGGWFSSAPRGSFGVGVWKNIRREAQWLKQDLQVYLER